MALSAKAGRPVKMVMTRDEVFRATGPAPGTKLRIKLGVQSDGNLVAGDAYLIYTNGAYAGPGGLLGAMTVFESYKIPNFEIEALDVVINTARSAAYRAPAAPLTAYAMETLLDEVAEEIGIDAMDLRLQNAVTEGDPVHDGLPVRPHRVRGVPRSGARPPALLRSFGTQPGPGPGRRLLVQHRRVV